MLQACLKYYPPGISYESTTKVQLFVIATCSDFQQDCNTRFHQNSSKNQLNVVSGLLKI
jgi:hypothetical protein